MSEINIELAESEENLEESVIETDTLKNCLILGEKSRNNRMYSPVALFEAVSLYNGSPVYLNHKNGERQIEDRIGTVKNARYDEGKGIMGDIECLSTHPFYATFKESYDKKVSKIGISHNSIGMGSVNDGITTVNKITKVISVDLVSSPATSTNLREAEAESESEKPIDSELMQLKEQVNLLVEELKQLKTASVAASKWIKPSSIPLTENELESIPKDLNKLAKWLRD